MTTIGTISQSWSANPLVQVNAEASAAIVSPDGWVEFCPDCTSGTDLINSSDQTFAFRRFTWSSVLQFHVSWRSVTLVLLGLLVSPPCQAVCQGKSSSHLCPSKDASVQAASTSVVQMTPELLSQTSPNITSLPIPAVSPWLEIQSRRNEDIFKRNPPARLPDTAATVVAHSRSAASPNNTTTHNQSSDHNQITRQQWCSSLAFP